MDSQAIRALIDAAARAGCEPSADQGRVYWWPPLPAELQARAQRLEAAINELLEGTPP